MHYLPSESRYDEHLRFDDDSGSLIVKFQQDCHVLGLSKSLELLALEPIGEDTYLGRAKISAGALSLVAKYSGRPCRPPRKQPQRTSRPLTTRIFWGLVRSTTQSPTRWTEFGTVEASRPVEWSHGSRAALFSIWPPIPDRRNRIRTSRQCPIQPKTSGLALRTTDGQGYGSRSSGQTRARALALARLNDTL